MESVVFTCESDESENTLLNDNANNTNKESFMYKGSETEIKTANNYLTGLNPTKSPDDTSAVSLSQRGSVETQKSQTQMQTQDGNASKNTAREGYPPLVKAQREIQQRNKMKNRRPTSWPLSVENIFVTYPIHK